MSTVVSGVHNLQDSKYAAVTPHNTSAFLVLVLGRQVNDTADEVAGLKRTAWSEQNHTSYSSLDLRVSYLMQAFHSQGRGQGVFLLRPVPWRRES